MSETVKPAVIETITAGADLSANRFITGAGALCGAGGKAAGVSVTEALSGKSIGVCVVGVCTVLAGASITAGQEVQSDASGCAIPLDTGKSNGVALSTAGTGTLLKVLVK